MRFRCTKCDVEWTSVTGQPECWIGAEKGEDHSEFVVPAFEIAPWRQGFEP